MCSRSYTDPLLFALAHDASTRRAALCPSHPGPRKTCLGARRIAAGGPPGPLRPADEPARDVYAGRGSDLATDSTRLRGEVLLAGDRYRVETPTQTIVANDSTTWIYAPADSQVVIRAADTAAVPLTPQSFLATATERYAVDAVRSSRWQGEPHRRFSLRATASSSRFRDATVWVRTADQVVTRLRATDRNGTTLDLRLRNIVLNPPLEDAAFTFRAPEGIRRVDLRPRTAP